MGAVKFNWDELKAICGGEWLLAGAGAGVDGVTDDSRIVEQGMLFVAIAGEIADGHKYIVNAAKGGAAAVVVSRKPSDEELSELRMAGCGCLLVSDGLAAFQALAGAHRRRYTALPLVGVTGSCGKTSTKEMCAAVLAQKYGNVVKTIGNTNNFFGAPRNLFRIDAGTGAAVIEMGSNHPGEIRRLASMVAPVTGIVCNIGAAHLEFFGDLRGVAEEKGDLLESLPADGTAIVPGEAVGLDILKRHAGNRRLLTFGSGKENNVRGTYLGVRSEGYGLRLSVKATGESLEFTWPIGGAHQAVNAAGAAAVGIVHGMSLADIAAGLQKCELPGARMKVEIKDGVHWVNDAYNANPSSMRASLEWLKEISQGAAKRTLVLGDMLELGDASEKEHAALLDYVAQTFADARIVTVGKAMAAPSESHKFTHFANVTEAAAALNGSFAEGEWVFLKGSNSIGLAKLMP